MKFLYMATKQFKDYREIAERSRFVSVCQNKLKCRSAINVKGNNKSLTVCTIILLSKYPELNIDLQIK